MRRGGGGRGGGGGGRGDGRGGGGSQFGVVTLEECESSPFCFGWLQLRAVREERREGRGRGEVIKSQS